MAGTLAVAACGPGAFLRGLARQDPVVPAAEPAARAAPEPELSVLELQIDAQLAARMQRVEDQARRSIARTICDEAALAGIDPIVVLAVIQVESAFDSVAVSRSGAVGLMQLLPSTMKEEAARSRLISADPRDPVVNVQAGVRYLHRQIRAFRKLDLALIAYNAGPGRTLRHLREGEIPDRFLRYPRAVKLEVARLRRGVAPSRERAVLVYGQLARATALPDAVRGASSTRVPALVVAWATPADEWRACDAEWSRAPLSRRPRRRGRGSRRRHGSRIGNRMRGPCIALCS